MGTARAYTRKPSRLLVRLPVKKQLGYYGQCAQNSPNVSKCYRGQSQETQDELTSVLSSLAAKGSDEVQGKC